MARPLDPETRRTLERPLRLTLAGLWAERLARAFWPLWSLLIAGLAALAFGVQDLVSDRIVWAGLGFAGLAVLVASWSGWRTFRRPTRADALARLDATLPGQPLATLTDEQAIGSGDPASQAVWAAHLRRMAARAALARPVSPDLRLATRDPYGLRYMALTALVTALIFGSLWRVASVAGLGPGPAEALIAGPSWEGWVQPPPYTGKPTLYLNDIDRAGFEVPVGSRVQLRFYGEVGTLSLSETVSGRDKSAPAPTEPVQDFDVAQSGTIGVEGKGGRSWQIVALKDAVPAVSAKGDVKRQADGSLKMPFSASDDYGVTGGKAVITLDLGAVDRRFGLAVEPEAMAPVSLDLPLPITGSRAKFDEVLGGDLAKSPLANLPVTVALSVTDAANQAGEAAPIHMILPGKRFFDPVAAAIIELRRDLLWSRANAPRAAQVFKAITHRPEGLIRNEKAYLQLRVAMRKLDSEAATLSVATRDELAETFWAISLMIEEGDLDSARERLKRAQDQLDQAIKDGADPSEIDRLMEELKQATDDYIRQLAEEAQRNPDGQAAQEQQSMEMSSDQLQQMMDAIKKALEEGRMDDAAQMMQALRDLMENMQVTQGGQGGPGQQAMKDLGQTLRDQQDLSDDSFSDLQNPDGQDGQDGQQGQQGQDGQQGQQGQDGQQGQQGQDGQQGQQGQDQQGRGQQGQGRGLAERQGGLRNRLGQLNGQNLPGAGSERGEAGRRALDEAGRSMQEAERALRDGDLPGALDRQAEAMQSMREGMRALGEALAQEQRQMQPGQADQGQAMGRDDPNSARDPLGREPGDGARIGSDRNLLQGEDVYRHAQDLLEEIRRRQGDQTRPEGERDYLKRLLGLF